MVPKACCLQDTLLLLTSLHDSWHPPYKHNARIQSSTAFLEQPVRACPPIVDVQDMRFLSSSFEKTYSASIMLPQLKYIAIKELATAASMTRFDARRRPWTCLPMCKANAPAQPVKIPVKVKASGSKLSSHILKRSSIA